MIPQVRILDNNSIARISAGEVILSPAMAVKELVENSIDSGAKRVDVEIQDGGYKLVSVSDDGCGMDEKNAILCLERHATSKIKSADELDVVNSFGFRGEAMAAMAAVCQMEIVSRPEEETTGVQLKIQGGEINSIKSVSANVGTVISLKNIFYNAAVRKRFQKSSRAEKTKVLNVLSKYILSRPDVAFKLIMDDKVRIATRANASLLENITAIYGSAISKELIEINDSKNAVELGKIKLTGYVSNADLFRGSSKLQLFFVNGRPVENRTVGHAIFEAYHHILPPKKYPVCFLFLEIDSKCIDINVHPTKKEVVFLNDRPVFSLVMKGIVAAFDGDDPFVNMPGERLSLIRDVAKEDGGVAQELFKKEDFAETFDPSKIFSSKLSGEEDEEIVFNTEKINHYEKNSESGFEKHAMIPSIKPEDKDEEKIISVEKEEKVESEKLRIIGQAYDTFIIAELREEILIIDQHVASERVLYEYFSSKIVDNKIQSQGLLIPLVIEPTIEEGMKIEENMEKLSEFGFHIEDFGPGTFVVKELPVMFDNLKERSLLREIIGDLITKLPEKKEKILDYLLSEAACKKAIKAGERLNITQSTHLIESLLKCNDPFRCPHGRPIVIKMGLLELLKKFGRR